MRANKLETAMSRDRLACLAPPDMVFLMYIASLFECMCICYSLNSNNISDEGARALADGMKDCTSLKTLE